MMEDRQLKRFWHNGLKQMFKVSAIDYDLSLITVSTDDGLEEFHISEGVLMDCIGLPDKNNTLIYEGDIVETWKFSTGKIQRSVIKWYEPQAGFKLFNIDSVGATPEKLNFKQSLVNVVTIEVLGNIYETPNLLEQKP